jgi:hypothetical protein
MVVPICLDATCKAMGMDMRDKSYFMENITMGGVIHRPFSMLLLAGFGRLMGSIMFPNRQCVCIQHIAIQIFSLQNVHRCS